MMNNLHRGIIFLCSVFLLPSYASIDPVAWSVLPVTGFPVVQPGGTAEVGYTLTNKLPRAVTLTTSFAQNGGPFVIHDQCNNQSVVPKGSCYIGVHFQPTAAGQSSIQLTYGYNNNRIPVPTLLANSIGGSGSGCVQPVTGCVSGTTNCQLQLPASTYQYADNVVKFVFQNTCTSQSAILGQASVTSNQSSSVATVTTAAQFDTCSNQALAAGAACYVIASVIPQQTTTSALTIQASLPENGTPVTQSTTTSAVIAMPNQTSTHNIVFVNQCPFPVWYEFENNGTSAPTADPTPPGGSYQLNAPSANGIPSPLLLPVAAYTNGAIYGRTGCNTTTGVCATGTCTSISASDPMRCAVGVHPSNSIQLTKIEMFMPATPNNDGVYDVSMVNGFNVPAEFRSLAPASANELFGCGQSAGALIQPAIAQPSSGDGLGNCPWTFSPPNTGTPDITANYVSVTGERLLGLAVLHHPIVVLAV